MDYPYKDFGMELKALRKNQGLTQEDVVNLTNGNISRPTLQRYESGKYAPSIESLSILSTLYHVDLYELFYVSSQKQTIPLSFVEKLLKKNLDISTSEELILGTNALLQSKSISPHLSSYYFRVSLLAKGIYLKHMGNHRKANSYLLQALRMQYKDFNLHNYTDYSYFSMDYRLLTNFIDNLVSFSNYHIPKAIEIYQFMVQNCPTSYPSYPQICLNLGFLYLDKALYIDAHDLFTMALKYSREHLNYSLLPQIYYGKAAAEYYLSSDNHISDFLHAYYLAKAFGNEEFVRWLTQTAQEIFQVDLPEILTPQKL